MADLSEQQLHNLHKELSDIMRKYDIKGVSGIFITANLDAFVTAIGPGTSPYKDLVASISEVLTKWQQDNYGGDIRIAAMGVSVPKAKEN